MISSFIVVALLLIREVEGLLALGFFLSFLFLQACVPLVYRLCTACAPLVYRFCTASFALLLLSCCSPVASPVAPHRHPVAPL